ncbi:DUF2280 domain-containing protein [Pseudomonas alvandae]|uniref:DUF2280 domain-containing protein n=1 Tax=Pseudomonas canavaninivorans TaxID=2842348 RepID=UPI002B1D2F41|nr:DUF2280 domain-containing protein [Pseudomonas canavaninivorans]
MATLNNEIKSFIVQALACFDSPSQVASACKERFGVVVSRQQVETHDPTRKSSKGLAKRWVTLFEDTRSSFRAEMVKEPIANRSMRLRALGRMLEEAEERGHLVIAMKLVGQAARECGDLYTNRGGQTKASGSELAGRIDVEFVLSSARCT